MAAVFVPPILTQYCTSVAWQPYSRESNDLRTEIAFDGCTSYSSVSMLASDE
jgi:hypothetical protein